MNYELLDPLLLRTFKFISLKFRGIISKPSAIVPRSPGIQPAAMSSESAEVTEVTEIKGNLEVWRVDLSESHFRLEATGVERKKFVGFYMKLKVANKKCRQILKSQQEELDKFQRVTDENSAVLWTGMRMTGDEMWFKRCTVRKEVLSTEDAQVFFLALVNGLTQFHADAEIKDFMIYGTLPESQRASSTIPISIETPKCQVDVFTVKLSLLFEGDDEHVQCLNESHGTYLDPEDASRKTFALLDESVRRGWFVNFIGGDGMDGKLPLYWMADKGVGWLVGRIDKGPVRDSAGLAKMIVTKSTPVEESKNPGVGSNKSRLFLLMAKQGGLRDRRSSTIDASVIQKFQAIYEAHTPAS